MTNLPRIPEAVEGVVEPGVSRVLTAWLRYDWSSRNKELFLEDQVPGIVPRTETERIYVFCVHMPPFSSEQSADVIELTANTYDDTGEALDPDEPMAPQIAKRMFHRAPHSFPGISPESPFESSWEGGTTRASFRTKFRGKLLRVTVEEIDG